MWFIPVTVCNLSHFGTNLSFALVWQVPRENMGDWFTNNKHYYLFPQWRKGGFITDSCKVHLHVWVWHSLQFCNYFNGYIIDNCNWCLRNHGIGQYKLILQFEINHAWGNLCNYVVGQNEIQVKNPTVIMCTLYHNPW